MGKGMRKVEKERFLFMFANKTDGLCSVIDGQNTLIQGLPFDRGILVKISDATIEEFFLIFFYYFFISVEVQRDHVIAIVDAIIVVETQIIRQMAGAIP